jgi:hypothetical protein
MLLGAPQTLPNSIGFGQSGRPVVFDLDGDYRNEIFFGSFDQNAVNFGSR